MFILPRSPNDGVRKDEDRSDPGFETRQTFGSSGAVVTLNVAEGGRATAPRTGGYALSARFWGRRECLAGRSYNLRMSKEIAVRIERAIPSGPDVTVAPHRFG